MVEELAGKGYSITMICSAIGINRSTAYRKKDVYNAIKRGQSQARQKVVDDLMARSESDQGATASIFLAKQLKVFDDPYPTSTPKTTSEAVSRIAKIYTDVARGNLDSEKGDHLISYLEKFIKGYEISDLEDRITELEKVASERR